MWVWLRHKKNLRRTEDTAHNHNPIPSTPLGWPQTYPSNGHPEDCVIMHDLRKGRLLPSPLLFNMKDPECIMPAMHIPLRRVKWKNKNMRRFDLSHTEWISNSVFAWFQSLQFKTCFWEIILANTNSYLTLFLKVKINVWLLFTNLNYTSEQLFMKRIMK